MRMKCFLATKSATARSAVSSEPQRPSPAVSIVGGPVSGACHLQASSICQYHFSHARTSCPQLLISFWRQPFSELPHHHFEAVNGSTFSSANVRPCKALRSRSGIARSSNSGVNRVTEASGLYSDGKWNWLDNDSIARLSSAAAWLSAMSVIPKPNETRDAESDEVSESNPENSFVMDASDGMLSPADDTTETDAVLPLRFGLLRILCEPDTVVAGMRIILGIAGTVFFTSVFTDSSNRASSCSSVRNESLAGMCFLRFCPE